VSAQKRELSLDLAAWLTDCGAAFLFPHGMMRILRLAHGANGVASPPAAGGNIVESNFIYQRDQLNFSAAEQSNYLTFAGVKIIMGGMLGKPMMVRFRAPQKWLPRDLLRYRHKI
jgi:hypothetical protein